MKHLNKVFVLLIVAFTMLLSINSVCYAAGIVGGKGSKKEPYVLQFDNVGDTVDIPYEKKADFWFEVVGNSANGTYCVQLQKEFKTVSITLESNDHSMYFLYEHQGDAYYSQAGAVAMPHGTVADPEENLCTFTITTLEEIDESKVKTNVNNRMSSFFTSYLILGSGANRGEYTLHNTHIPGEEPTIHHPNYFIFAPWGTVKELYEEQAIKITAGHERFKHIKYGADNNAQYILDPTYITGYDIIKGESTYNPTRTIIFGKYNHPDENSKPDYVSSDAEVEYTENYALKIKYHFESNEEEVEEKAGIIETAITYILLGIGMLLIITIKIFLGSGLTMDAVIFNRYDMTIVDFRGRVGFLANENVRNIINVMYDGFEWLAIIANLIILLYLGIQIILAVGTEKQPKYLKYLQNWVVGLLILFMAPQCFPFITDISNAIVGYIGSSVTPHVTQYNVAAVLDDESVLGENADTAYIKKKAETGRKEREKEIKEKEKEILQKTESLFNDSRYSAIKIYHDKQQEWYEKEYRRRGEANGKSEEEIQKDIKEAQAKADFMGSLNEVIQYLEDNRANWNLSTMEGFENEKEKFNKQWKAYEGTFYRTACVAEGCQALINGTQVYHSNGKDTWWEEVHSPNCDKQRVYPIKQAMAFINDDSLLQMHLEVGEIEEEYNILNAYLNTKDLMTEMRIKAGVTGRVTYVLIWYILVFQLISVLAMYFKRIIMISILIMIFPIVMITYAIDKISDGKAQTLETWFKEFSVNILVQIAHAVIYVTLIKTGLAIFEANPKNWLIYIIAVTSLFPMERLLRGIFGMTGGTMGQLKASVAAGAALAWKAAKTGGKGVRSANNFRKDAKALGVKGAVKKRVDEAKEKRDERKAKEKEAQDKRDKEKETKDKKRQSVEDRKKRTRDSKIQLRREKMQGASGLKKAYYKTLNAASMVRNGMYHTGKLKRKVKGLARTPAARFAGKAFKGFTKANLMGIKALSGSLSAIEASGKGAGILKSGAAGLATAKAFNGITGSDKKKEQEQKGKAQAKPKPNVVKPLKPKNAKNGPTGSGKGPQTAKQRAANAKNSRANTKAAKHRIKNVKRINRQINVTQVPDNNSQTNNS